MDRASIFADEKIAKLIREHFVLVASDKWYDRRRKDAQGRFMRKLCEQAAELRPGTVFRQGVGQGMYCFTADGKLLNWRNHTGYPDVIRRELEKALFEWDQLPAERRKPGAVTVEEQGRPEPKYQRELPPGGLVVNTFIRVLDKKDDEFVKGTSSREGGTYAARDHLWITKEEWRALAPANARKGDTVEMPANLRQRILRCHLVDHTRGQAYAWRHEEIRESAVSLTVVEASESRLRLKLEGSALFAAAADLKEARKGYDVAFLGYIDFDRAKGKITRFDFVAIGDHWGEGRYNRGARPGRTPLGVAFELAADDDPFRSVPPQDSVNYRDYFGRN